MLLAPDKFKGSLTAVEVARHLAAGLRRAEPGIAVTLLPVADGGDGTVDAAVAAGFARREAVVAGPLGDPVRAAFALRGETAVVEMAEASGLRRLPGGRPEPLRAGTHGTGELIRAALDAGARTVVLGVGGSASTDGGAGLLTALGARLLDAAGHPLPPGGGGLAALDRIDLSGLDARLADTGLVLASDVDNPLLGEKGAAAVYGPQKGAGPGDVARLADTGLVLASDVDNPLLGEKGAAAVYGPQKGAGPGDVARLEAGLARFADVLGRAAGPGAARAAELPGAGAAGGAGYGAMAALGAVRRPGIEVLLEVLGFAHALEQATLVVTGEGALDRQTLHGKAPLGVAEAARRHGLPVVAVCGRFDLTAAQSEAAGFLRVYALTALQPDPARSIAEAGPLLERVGEALARDLSAG
ncbi:glycerate kinase [Peterkaempfera bronchialis]|uniref:Glycerate kinase n=1 Tax=Peterkaempfera bronchialis TaxID=2126346 RepID=A0A345T5B9_9ACTN|nr:glycerate kinase [Peterkaempfera bronchialis]AXI81174.1 glycerate kinase [Peterkaempfera bronchialis]